MRGRTLFITVCVSLIFGAVAAFALFEALHRPGGPGDAGMQSNSVDEKGSKIDFERVKTVALQATHELLAVSEVLWYDAEFYVSKFSKKVQEDIWPVIKHYAKDIVWPFAQHHATETVWPFLVTSFEWSKHVLGDVFSKLLGPLSGEKAVSGIVPQNRGDIMPAMPLGHDVEALTPQTQAFPAQGQYPITKWRLLDKRLGGYIEHVFVNSRPMVSGGVISADADLLVFGWAGDRSGTRFPHVLLTMCDKVIGVASVHRDTPFVQRFVHKKLVQAGWVALIPAGVLPRCDNSRLGALAVHGKNTAIRLRGEQALRLGHGGNPSRGGPFSPVVRPEL